MSDNYQHFRWALGWGSTGFTIGLAIGNALDGRWSVVSVILLVYLIGALDWEV